MCNAPWANSCRTASGPGSPRGQPAWGGGSDRIMGSTPRIISNLDIHGVGEKVNVGSGRYHHPTRAARAGAPVRSRFRIGRVILFDNYIAIAKSINYNRAR
jgi:hypothetical protein